MKIAVVNLSILGDVSRAPEFDRGIALLAQHGIGAIDCASRRFTPTEMVAGLHEALDRDDVNLVLTYSGGSALIQCLDKIAWDRVGSSGKLFAGHSDFTHFAWKAVERGVPCVYGLALEPFMRYWRTGDLLDTALRFFRTGSVDPLKPSQLRGSNVVDDWANERIVGGHSFISFVMAAESKIDLTNRVFFLEHHYNHVEDIDGLRYWFVALGRMLERLPPKAILLGQSMVFDDHGHTLPVDTVNEFVCEQLAYLSTPIYYVDHFTTLIPLR